MSLGVVLVIVAAAVWCAVLVCAIALCRAAAAGDRIENGRERCEPIRTYRQYPQRRLRPVPNKDVAAPLATAGHVTHRSPNSHEQN